MHARRPPRKNSSRAIAVPANRRDPEIDALRRIHKKAQIVRAICEEGSKIVRAGAKIVTVGGLAALSLWHSPKVIEPLANWITRLAMQVFG